MNSDLTSYIQQHIDAEPEYLYRLWRATNVHLLHGRMASGHMQGRLLKMFVEMIRPRYILEVGTFSGYSAICMAEGLRENERARESFVGAWERESAGARIGSFAENLNSDSILVPSLSRPLAPSLITFEINDEMEEFTRPWIEGSSVAEYIDFRIGDAITEAPKLGITFDMAFIDGDKRTYVETYEMVLSCLSDGGWIFADNTLWDGHVTDQAYDKDSQTLGIRRFNDLVAQDQRVEKVILPLRDGLTILRKKQ